MTQITGVCSACVYFDKDLLICIKALRSVGSNEEINRSLVLRTNLRWRGQFTHLRPDSGEDIYHCTYCTEVKREGD